MEAMSPSTDSDESTSANLRKLLDMLGIQIDMISFKEKKRNPKKGRHTTINIKQDLKRNILKCMKFIDCGNTLKNYKNIEEITDYLLDQAELATDKILFEKPLRDKSKELINLEKYEEMIEKTDNTLKKPQDSYIIDNSYNQFVPLIDEKYYTTYLIPTEIVEMQNRYNDNDVDYCEVNINDAAKSYPPYPHPYKRELDELQYTQNQLSVINTKNFKKLSDTPLRYILSERDLENLANELSTITELAIDLEHHSYRSYLGITCLMQISNRNEDFIIDTLAVRNYMKLLRPIFANPGIVKVFHGSGNDIKWLQRDFGIYVVNMFDTAMAAKVLGYDCYSLKNLIEHFCKVYIDKMNQLADWRIRPLTFEMLEYARGDTHYLLYIYDVLRKKLITMGRIIDKKLPFNSLIEVLDKSKEICSSIYMKPILKSQRNINFIDDYIRSFNPKQNSILKLMLKWRDYIARVEDESIDYVCPNKSLLSIAEHMPKNDSDLKKCWKTPLLEKYSEEILKHIMNECEKCEV